MGRAANPARSQDATNGLELSEHARLPKTNGRQLAEQARQRKPDLRVLFATGYAKNAIVHHGRPDRDVDLIGKPIAFSELSHTVGSMPDRRREGE